MAVNLMSMNSIIVAKILINSKHEKKTYSFFMKAAWPSGRG